MHGDLTTSTDAASPMETPDGERPATRRARILIVDDERGPRESLRMILSTGNEVSVAENGNEALDLLRTTPTDLVTVDLNMPGMKGDELMRTIRDEFPHVEVIIITGCSSVETAVEGIRYGIFDYLTKPFDVVQVTAAVERALNRQRTRRRLVEFLDGIGEVVGRNRESSDILTELRRNDGLKGRLRSVFEEPVLAPIAQRGEITGVRTVAFLEVLAETIENRDVRMRGHARRVAFLSALLAERLNLGIELREQIRLAAFLHDIGKVGTPADVLVTEGALSEKQELAIQAHPEVGERLLRPLGFQAGVSGAIRHHHERFDGRGYPDGLRGEDIPLASRIIAVADAYDAMTLPKPFRSAKTRSEAVRELSKEAGSQFDPAIVEQFLKLVDSGAVDTYDDEVEQDDASDDGSQQLFGTRSEWIERDA